MDQSGRKKFYDSVGLTPERIQENVVATYNSKGIYPEAEIIPVFGDILSVAAALEIRTLLSIRSGLPSGHKLPAVVQQTTELEAARFSPSACFKAYQRSIDSQNSMWDDLKSALTSSCKTQKKKKPKQASTERSSPVKASPEQSSPKKKIQAVESDEDEVPRGKAKDRTKDALKDGLDKKRKKRDESSDDEDAHTPKKAKKGRKGMLKRGKKRAKKLIRESTETRKKHSY